MKFRSPHFRTGIALTSFLALLAVQLGELPLFVSIGPLAIALVAGMLARIALHIPEEQRTGINFSSKYFLRIGIVLIGVRLNFNSLLHTGPTMVLLTLSIVAGGLLFIPLLGRCFKLPRMLSLLIAIDSSICGGSAVAAIAPSIGACEEEIALVIPLCSLIGMAAMFALSAVRHFFDLIPTTFGLLAGGTLHEVAQVMAAVSSVPEALEIGTATKFMRVILLAPAIFILSWVLSHPKNNKSAKSQKISLRALLDAVWFVFGFLLIGLINTVASHFFPALLIEEIDHHCFTVALFLMAMAMAGVGLQVDFTHLRKHGLRSLGVAITGWLFLLALAALEIHVMRP